MRRKYWLIIAAVLFLGSSNKAFAQDVPALSVPGEILRNGDVLSLTNAGVEPGVIIAKIMSSHCNFDVFPPVLQDLRRRGVTGAVLQAMVMAPHGPPDSGPAEKNSPDYPQATQVKIRAGTEVKVETVYPASLAERKEGSLITLLVVQPVLVEGVLAIPRGAVAKARVVRIKKGRSRSMYWELDHIVGLDGSRIPAELAKKSEGGSRAAQRGSSTFAAVISGDTEVVGERLDNERVIYHYIDALQAKIGTSYRTPTRRQSFRTSARRRRSFR